MVHLTRYTKTLGGAATWMFGRESLDGRRLRRATATSVARTSPSSWLPTRQHGLFLTRKKSTMAQPAIATHNFSKVDALLHSLVADHTFPGATALVADRTGILHAFAAGRLTYALDAPPMTASTYFDVASLTKVLVTTTCAMLLFQSGTLHLDEPII